MTTRTHTRLIHKAFGSYGEQHVAAHLQTLGYRARLGAIAGAGDVVVNDLLAVEVKSAYLTRRRRRNYPRWQFSFHRNNHPNSADIYILLCWDSGTAEPQLGLLAAFVIPGHHLSVNLKKIDIPRIDPKNYRGKWSRWLEAWPLLAEVLLDLQTGTRIPLTDAAVRIQDPIPF